MTWLNEIFGVAKPVIGMCHLRALPGDPRFDAEGGLDAVLAHARTELRKLQDGGVDAVMISNEFSLPYLTKTEPITAITMARIIGELRSEIRLPFGVDVLWDPVASIDLAVATGAGFLREVLTGVYGSDYGVWNTDVGATARHRRRVGGEGVRMLYNIVPESAAYLGDRDLLEVTRSTVFNARPDAICVSGLTAGSVTDPEHLRTVKRAAGDTPVFVNTGVNVDNVGEQLGIADGAVVGTFFKEDGDFDASVDPERVSLLMKEVARVRGA